MVEGFFKNNFKIILDDSLDCLFKVMIKVLWQHDSGILVDGNRQDRGESQLKSNFHIPKPFRMYSASNITVNTYSCSNSIPDRNTVIVKLP